MGWAQALLVLRAMSRRRLAKILSTLIAKKLNERLLIQSLKKQYINCNSVNAITLKSKGYGFLKFSTLVECRKIPNQ
ncbi:MAG: hypothetical protein ACI9WC_001861 [Arenicella sp.]|jgi:hypothetical protein